MKTILDFMKIENKSKSETDRPNSTSNDEQFFDKDKSDNLDSINTHINTKENTNSNTKSDKTFEVNIFIFGRYLII